MEYICLLHMEIDDQYKVLSGVMIRMELISEVMQCLTMKQKRFCSVIGIQSDAICGQSPVAHIYIVDIRMFHQFSEIVIGE